MKSFDEEPAGEIYASFMSKIIEQIPGFDNLSLLLGTSSNQASFYFKNDSTDEINATLYNNKLAPRIIGKGTQFGINQVGLSNEAFTNSYSSVFNKIEYKLSTADKIENERLQQLTHDLVIELVPIWNEWLKNNPSPFIRPLDSTNADRALIEMTNVLQVYWVSLDYIEVLRNDPSYPYLNTDEFCKIFDRIPQTVPHEMIDLMINIYSVQGKSGELTAKLSLAAQTLNGVRANLISPRMGPDGNGGLKLSDQNKVIPGMTFTPPRASIIKDQLNANPPDPELRYTSSESKASNSKLLVAIDRLKNVEIPALNFLSLEIADDNLSSIFSKSYAGTKFKVELNVKNPCYQPPFTFNPLQYDPYTHSGWMANHVIKEALENGISDKTGYFFTSQPDFDFSNGGNFGYINTMIFSQFLQLKIEFIDGNPSKIKNYFNKNAHAPVRFLNMLLPKTEDVSNPVFSVVEENQNTVTIIIDPAPPGYIPPSGDNIAASLSSLIAVCVTYPIAKD